MIAQDLANRLAKTWKQRQRWAEREGVTAFRVYDLDMPEWPLAVDWYAGSVHVSEYPSRRQRQDPGFDAKRTSARAACTQALGVADERIFWKRHEPKKAATEQYERLGGTSALVDVREHGLTFECNLSDYLDTGLFLDHRPLRRRVRQEAAGKRVLNLFAYTGAFTVHARAGGASRTTTVDLSNTYCAWAERNLAKNGLSPSAAHQVVRGDVLAWLERAREPVDLIVLDPPSFSLSKRMGTSFDVQRDHRALVEQCLRLLAPGGVLYFSTNLLGFALDERLPPAEALDTLPADFRRQVHQSFRFVQAGG